MSKNDAVAALSAAGIPMDSLTDEQKSKLAQLSTEEIAVLAAVKGRLDAVTDVQAHGAEGAEGTGIIIW
ncbi:hypothetical protein G5C60_17940 [Streptomyces sp. HC44]|uniref:Uncharacterized protein n=1 Tax=Streptomyces scabichelini TaxID=2711217 RepID=A0A6G4V5X9_9ACTN|nr:aroma-sacti cluster domain-containing protein [Streptomyces scabichelini]NGO09426.1 hypothetical protein [Streptomyces scabichelini]